ncbi:MAG: DNA topoisomerase VI subunit B [Bdellovibrionaceae bacterium]|nr:DNA topoisomerase VI subunit B [Pseudobdellovibrionaceae bacterium]
MAKITSSSTAEYFAKNLQQVGFSSATKAVLTTLKETVDNSLDACEDHKILPELKIEIEKIGTGGSKSADLIRIMVEDNGPGLSPEDLPRVFGEYLASSKFGRGRCSRGQQGIGISAATTWAQLTNAAGAKVLSKTKNMRKAIEMRIDVDIKSNKGLVKDKKTVDWDKDHGLRVEFVIDGRLQLNGDGGILTYLEGTSLVNPHLKLHYKINDDIDVNVDRVTEDVPVAPPATLPHPHTMKLGEFMTHAHLFGNVNLQKFLKTGFSRVTDSTLSDFVKNGMPKKFLAQPISKTSESEFKDIFKAIQETELPNPTTRSVLTIGEEALANSIQRLGAIDFFSIVTRKPKICDFKPVVVEVAIARFLDRGKEDESIQLLRFANRVPLQFDKAGCAITKAVESVNWRSYGLNQSKNNLPLGPYIFAISVTSPFIKFKNASKETIDSSDELVEEIRRALMQTGQKLSRHIRREAKAADLERKLQHIEKFGPILVRGLVQIVGAADKRRDKATEGLEKILGRDTNVAEKELEVAESRLQDLKQKEGFDSSGSEDLESFTESEQLSLDSSFDKDSRKMSSKPNKKKSKTSGKKAVKKASSTKAAAKKASKKVAARPKK